MCSQLYHHLKAQGDSSAKQICYTACWQNSTSNDEVTKVCKLKEEKNVDEKKKKEDGSKQWDPLDHLPPPPVYPEVPIHPVNSPPPPPGSPPVLPPTSLLTSPTMTPNPPQLTFPPASLTIGISPTGTPPPPPLPQINPSISKANPFYSSILPSNNDPIPPLLSTVPTPLPNWEIETLASSVVRRQTVETPEGLYQHTRSKARLFPLREVPMGGVAGGIEFVNAPLTASEVRNFKKELGNLVEDPVGMANQINYFWGPSIYTWEELN